MQEQLLDPEGYVPPAAIPRREYSRSTCKGCGKRIAWAVMANALNETIRRNGQPVRVPLDVFPVHAGKLRLVPTGRVREVSVGELYLGDRFQRHTCKRGKR